MGGYPEHLDSCHATANLALVEEWSFPGGEPQRNWKRQRSTAFNTLDRLYAAICNGDKDVIRRHSGSLAIARRIEALRPKAATGTPAVSYPQSLSSTESKTIGVENLGVMFHFASHRGVWVVTKLEPLGESGG